MSPADQPCGRRRRKQRIDGWLIVDKPAGMTSTHVVNRVRRLTNAAKAGHGGTLDPLATGVLPLAFGEATKTVPFVVDGTKSYRFTVRWGEQRDTDDADGEVVRTSAHRPETREIEAALADFTGDIMQRPPSFSAVKVDGARAYDLARRDQNVALEPRPVRIERLVLVERPDPDHAVFDMDCGKGGYVRAIARDLGETLGTAGHVTALCRARVGPFRLEHAISLAELEALTDSAAALDRLMPVAYGLAGLPMLPVNADQASRLKHGQSIALVRAPVDVDGNRIKDPGPICALFADRPVALVAFDGGELRPSRVFNY